mgnify:CR=1 FL=1
MKLNRVDQKKPVLGNRKIKKIGIRKLKSLYISFIDLKNLFLNLSSENNSAVFKEFKEKFLYKSGLEIKESRSNFNLL